ncbi:hypothetical protein Ahy_A03g012467 isoform B [Arachis hypogaea]|uniref:Uncharacterized protein n=2 Tax=Arachis hypogaea TaxID=3818 RepID=A0A445DTI7_ARAHY|nr:hypothetical protein Ahy_A03g012467 isoform B [Arachis hypogaea]
MAAIQKLLNIALHPLSLVLLSSFMIPFLIFKVFIYVRNLFQTDENGRRGAVLSLVDIREDNLVVVAEKARSLGSPDVIIIAADVSKLQDCRRFVDQTVNHFGRLDCLVNNAGIGKPSGFKDWSNASEFTPMMASKAAAINYFETLRMELGRAISITIVTPGLINTDLGLTVVKEERIMEIIPLLSASELAESIVKSACRGDMYLTEPSWVKVLFPFKLLYPQLVDSAVRSFIGLSRKINNSATELKLECCMLGMQNASVTLAPWDIYHIYESTSLVFPPISLTVFLQAATIMVVDEWILNILVPPTCIALLLFILPPYLLFKIIYYVLRSLLKENVAGKVILITGASSGIGEHIAYEYGRRGARLALVARRENRLKEVAQRAMALGSPHVITIPADVSILKDCQRFVDCTVNRFGRLDHLVNNAGVVPVCLFEHATDISNFAPAMDINLWGSAYATYFSIPHLRKSRGKIIAIASSAGWLPTPRMIFYNASKAAVISLYESLRTELGKDIGITIVTPGLVESEMTQGKFLSKDGQMVLDQEMRDVLVSLMPIRSVTEAAKSIVNSACRGDPYLTEPAWIRTTLYLQIFCPQLLEYLSRWTLISGTSERDTISKKLLHLSCLKKYLYPESVRNPTLQPN